MDSPLTSGDSQVNGGRNGCDGDSQLTGMRSGKGTRPSACSRAARGAPTASPQDLENLARNAAHALTSPRQDGTPNAPTRPPAAKSTKNRPRCSNDARPLHYVSGGGPLTHVKAAAGCIVPAGDDRAGVWARAVSCEEPGSTQMVMPVLSASWTTLWRLASRRNSSGV